MSLTQRLPIGSIAQSTQICSAFLPARPNFEEQVTDQITQSSSCRVGGQRVTFSRYVSNRPSPNLPCHFHGSRLSSFQKLSGRFISASRANLFLSSVLPTVLPPVMSFPHLLGRT